jgi:hypothetical protein
MNFFAFGANFISCWIRIQETNRMWIHADPDPKHWCLVSIFVFVSVSMSLSTCLYASVRMQVSRCPCLHPYARVRMSWSAVMRIRAVFFRIRIRPDR